ncbi:MAG: hypothetical protein NC548_39510 [Lachnospiraceae bacterium]|nr:hypothetical protein [Lachnospiraceae bacterium]
MSDYSSRYYQLTSDILIEYNYALEGGDSGINMFDVPGHMVITNPNPFMKFYCLKENYDNVNLDQTNFVIPTNKSETSFVKPYTKSGRSYVFSPPSDMKVGVQEFNFDQFGKNTNIIFDKVRFHFTGRNFIGDYDSLIIQAYIFTNQKQKIGLASFRIAKTDDVVINGNPLILNQKQYVSYIDIKIPSTYELLKSYDKHANLTSNFENDNTYAYGILKKYLDIDKDINKIITNSSIMFNLYGVKHEIRKNGYEYYLTENISKVSIPSKDTFDDVYVDIEEAGDGDYFTVNVRTKSGLSFSDFVYNLDENPSNYMIMHELSLTEYYIYNNKVKSERTHLEQYLVNAKPIYVEENDEYDLEINEDGLDDAMWYRPVCKHNSNCFKFVIEDLLKIINTNDNTTIVKKGTLTCNTPYKYGKRMNQIYMTETPPVVNVYNKRMDSELDTDVNAIKITNGNGGGNVKLETSTQQITAFVECSNIVVTVSNPSASQIENYDYLNGVGDS